MKDLYIAGAGGFGREVAWLVERINENGNVWNIKGFIDDNSALHGKAEDGHPVIGGCDFFSGIKEESWVVCAVGAAETRKRIIEKLKKYPCIRFATLIDPNVQYSPSVKFGEGSIVCAGTVLTVDIKVGNHVLINLDCTVGHDVEIGDYATIYPGVHISGNVTVGDCVELGTGMQIIQGKTIEEGCILGAGSVVVKDITEKGTYIGVPARNVNEDRKIWEVGIKASI